MNTESQLTSLTGFWKVIAELRRPRGRAIWSFLIMVISATIALFEDSPPLTYLCVAIAASTLIAVVEYGHSTFVSQHTYLHIEKVRDLLTFTLRVTNQMINEQGAEKLQLAIMLPSEREWYPAIRYDMKRGKHEIHLKRGAVWMALVDRGAHNGSYTMPLTEGVRIQLTEEERDCFADVRTVLVTPLHKPNRAKNLDNLIGALVIYSDFEEKRSLLSHSDTHESTSLAGEKIAQIMSYEHICS